MNPLTVEQERACLVSKDKRSVEMLVLSNKPIAAKYALLANRRFPHIAVEDLMQEGLMALYVAVHRFDATKDNRFTTYADMWIKGAIRRFVNENASCVSYPQEATKQMSVEYEDSIESPAHDPERSYLLKEATSYASLPPKLRRICELMLNDPGIDISGVMKELGLRDWRYARRLYKQTMALITRRAS